MKALITILISIGLVGFTVANNLPNQGKAPVRIYLDHYKNSEKHELSVRVLTKTDKRYRPAAEVVVALYISEVSPQNLLGKIVTTDKGTATYTFTQGQFELAENMKIAQYFAVVSENDTLKGKENKIIIKKVNLDVRFFVEDSVNQIQAHVSETDSTGNIIPQKGVKIQFLVERPLSPLPVGDDAYTTDDEGNVSMEFPDDLPGDTEGHVRAIVRIEENEDYGTVEISEVKKWGIPTFVSDETIKRSLWASSANAPILLLIFINALIAVVWGIIFYIVFKIFEIRKIGT